MELYISPLMSIGFWLHGFSRHCGWNAELVHTEQCSILSCISRLLLHTFRGYVGFTNLELSSSWYSDLFIIMKCLKIFLCVVRGFELRVLCLAGRCSTTCATPPILFCSGYLKDRVLPFVQACLDYDISILCFLLLLGWQQGATMPSYTLK
jgi:hypothetical protein